MPDPDRDETVLDPSDGAGISAEDGKLVTLARSARARLERRAGAAVRDETGRTYVGATVDLPSLRLTALQAAAAAAVSSGASRLEAAVVVSEIAEADAVDLATMRDLAGDGTVVLHVAGPDGLVRRSEAVSPDA